MTREVSFGPVIVVGFNNPPTGPASTIPGATGAPTDYNPDAGPSMCGVGWGQLDPRFPVKGDQGYPAINTLGVGGTPAPVAVGMLSAAGILAIDQIPTTKGNAVIAALQNATATGTALTLVTTTTSAANVTIAAQTILQTGNVVPAGVVALDLIPATISFGQTGAVALVDPTVNIARCLSITGVSGGAGGAFLVSGYDLYGYAQTETITAAASVATTNGKKGWKFVKSVVPQFSDAHNYSVGTADIIEFPLRVDRMEWVEMWYAGSWIASTSGFTAAVTSAASAGSGSMRGTFALPSAANNSNRLAVYINPGVNNIASITGLFGVTPA